MNSQWKNEMKKELDTLEVPDVSKEVIIAYDERAYAKKQQTKKRGLFLKFGCSFAALILVGGAIYGASKYRNNPHGSNSTSVTPTPGLTTNKEIFAFESFSSLTFVSNQQLMRQMRRRTGGITLDMQTQIQKEVSKILPLLESTLLVEDGIQITTSENKKEGYEFADEVRITLEQKEEVYYLYYNKTEKIEIDEDEKEVTTYYRGEMVFNSLDSYRFEMKGEIEEDHHEVEKESKFTLYTGEGNDNAIITERSIENGEEEFTYKVKENGEDVFEVSIEIEDKNGKIETTVEYENEQKDIEFEYIFSQEEDEKGPYYLLKGIQKEETDHSIRIHKNEDGNYEMTFYDAKNENLLNV